MKSLLFKCLIFAAIINFGIIIICSSPEDTKADVQKNMIVVCQHKGGGYSYSHTSQYPPPPGICDGDAKVIAVIITDHVVVGGGEEPIGNPSVEALAESDVIVSEMGEEGNLDYYASTCECKLKDTVYKVICMDNDCLCCDVLQEIEDQLPID